MAEGNGRRNGSFRAIFCRIGANPENGRFSKLAGQMAGLKLKFGDFLHIRLIFPAILTTPPQNGRPAISPAIFRPFLVLGRFQQNS